MNLPFEEVISTRERLRQFVKEPNRRVSHKSIDYIDDICRRFIAASPFVVVASRGADGRLSLSPKGDPAGFVMVLDDKTLIIPDRLGNNRVDTFENLTLAPEIGLLFLIPGNGDTLRISGKGRIVRDTALQGRAAVNGKAANLLLAVTVEQAFMHCPKCILRSHLWEPAHWPDLRDVPRLAEAMVTHGRLEESVSDMQAIIERDGQTRLY